MKTLKYLSVAVFALSAVSCYNTDILPKTTITEEVLLNSDYGIRKYLAIAYHQLPVEDFNYKVNNGYNPYGQGNDWWDSQKSSPAVPGAEATGFFSGQYEGFDFWTYNGDHSPWARIRGLNNFLAAFPAYSGNFNETEYNAYVAEVRFLRAFYYFVLARTYGGLPLITEALDPLASIEDLQIARATEYDTWKFIYEDLKYAMENGSTDKAATKGRANRYVAAALMSRAMLYAGSIAKYTQYAMINPGEAIRTGLQGMPAESAAEFFQYACDGAEIVKEGGYTLHTGADKEKAFTEVFLNDTSEDIFVKDFKVLNGSSSNNTYLMNSWDAMVLPNGTGMATGPGATLCPAWSLVSLYEMPAIATDEGELSKPVRFNDPSDLWRSPQMEARARATIYFSGMTETASNTVLDFQAGVYTDYPGTVADGTSENAQSQNAYTNGTKTDGTVGDANAGRRKRNDNANATVDIGGVNYKVTGAHGSRLGVENRTISGNVIRKYVSNNSALRNLHQGQQSWKLMRYGEVLLNWAEAAYELGRTEEASGLIAELRDRAGATPHALVANPVDVGMLPVTDGGLGYNHSVDENLQFIRDERARELAFENHRIFALKRWRVAHQLFQNYPVRVLLPYYVIAENKWIFLPEMTPMGHNRINFNRQRYYRQIPGGALERNTLLIRNDGY